MKFRWEIIIVTILVLAFGVFVWPTRWEYISRHDDYFWRVDRVTGHVEWHDASGWHREGDKK